MSDALDRVLEALDVGLQVPPEAMGLHSTDYDDRLCARCRYTDRDGGEFCGACRAWLSAESDVDPLGVDMGGGGELNIEPDGPDRWHTIEIEVSPEVAAAIQERFDNGALIGSFTIDSFTIDSGVPLVPPWDQSP